MFTIAIVQHPIMMKFLIISAAMLMMANGQRPSYASSGPIGRPGLASRFKEDNESSSTTVAVVNRVGEDGSTPKIPVDARGDVDLVNTLNTWEREHQPFWLLNADHIEKARNTTRGTQQGTNANQLDSLNNRGTLTNSQGVQGSSLNGRGGISDVQTNLSNRNGSPNNLNNSNRRNDNDNNNNNSWLYGNPTRVDIRPVYETPERLPTNQGARHQGQRQSGGSQKKLRFHYERNSFP